MTIRAVAMVEAAVVSGSAKPVLDFAVATRDPAPDTPAVDVSLVVFHRGAGPPDTPLMRAIAARGLDVDVVNERGPFDPAVLSQLRAVMAARRPDIVWSNSVKSHFLVRFAGLNRGRRWVAFHHGYTSTDAKMLVYNQIDRWSLREADGVLTVCQPFARELRGKGVSVSRIRVQHMPVRPFTPPDGRAIDRVRTQYGLPEDIPVLLTIGRLSREKGHIDLLHAAAALRSLRPARRFRLVFVGAGPERERLAALSRELHLGGAVVFAGQQDDVAPFYAVASVFVLPSHSEGSPNVLLEAFAAGIPVVATSVGGVPELARDRETAILVPPHSPEALASAVESIWTGPADAVRRMAENGRLVACTRHTIDGFRRSITEFFEQTLRG